MKSSRMFYNCQKLLNSKIRQCAYLLLIFISCLNATAQTWTTPTGLGGNYTSSVLRNVFFNTISLGWVVGDQGLILKTTNGGITWERNISPVQVNLNDVYFTSTTEGWIVGDGGVLLKTINGGATWIQVPIAGFNQRIMSIQFVPGNSQVGWFCGEGGNIYKTVDGGETWIVMGDFATTETLNALSIFSESQITAVGTDEDYTTTNTGGITWFTNFGNAPQSYNDINYNQNNIGIVAGEDIFIPGSPIKRSTDGGLSWNSITGVPTSIFNGVASAGNSFWAVGELGRIIKSEDEGITWIQQNSQVGNISLRKIFAVDDQVLYIVGASGIILKTTDGGDHWSPVTIQAADNLESISYGTGTHVWAVGSSGRIFRSIDGGIQWISQISGGVEFLQDVRFVSNQRGWICGNNGTILATTNGGTNWTNQTSGTNQDLHTIFFTDINNGWVGGKGRTLLRTNNGGLNWSSIPPSSLNPNDTIHHIFFFNTTLGWLVTQNGNIAHTTNGGTSWTIQHSQNSSLQSIFFSTSQIGWSVGSNGTVLRTTNGGNTWQQISSGTTQQLFDIYFSDPYLGWIVGEDLIFRSDDGGLTWSNTSIGNVGSIKKITHNLAKNLGIITNRGNIFIAQDIPLTFYSRNGVATNLLSSWNRDRLALGASPSSFNQGDRFIFQSGTSQTLGSSQSWNITSNGVIHIEPSGTFRNESSQTVTFGRLQNEGSFIQLGSNLQYGIIRNLAGSTISVENNGVLTLPANASFQNQGSLILRSTASGTGQIGPLGTGASISGTGTFTIERFIAGGTGRRRFRFFGHPFQNAIALSQLGNDADEIDVTGVGGTTNGFTTATVTNNPSAFWYQTNNGNPTGTSVGGSTDPGWTPFTAANVSSGANAWNRYQGIRVLVRGTRGQGLDGSAYTPGNATIRLSGTFNTGTQTISLLKGAQSGFNLVANPYPATINLRSVFSDASNSSISPLGVYVFNANAGTVGAYEVVTNITTQDYFLPSMGVFLIDVNSAADLTIRESHKSTSSSGVSLFNTDVSAPSISVNLMKDNHGWDRWILQHQSSATNGLELNFIQDVKKLFNEGGNVYSKVLGQSLAVDARSLKEEQSIPLHLSRLPLTDSFQLKLEMGGDDFQQNVFLIDRLRNMRMKVQSGFSYSFLPNESELSQRFVLELKKPASISHSKEFKLSPTLFHSNQSVQFNIELELQEAQLVQAQLLSIDGAIIAQTNFGIGNSFATKWNLNKNLQAGIYIVRLLVGNEQIAQKIIVQ